MNSLKILASRITLCGTQLKRWPINLSRFSNRTRVFRDQWVTGDQRDDVRSCQSSHCLRRPHRLAEMEEQDVQGRVFARHYCRDDRLVDRFWLGRNQTREMAVRLARQPTGPKRRRREFAVQGGRYQRSRPSHDSAKYQSVLPQQPQPGL